MSGILGFACDRPQTVQLDRLRRALRHLEYRGQGDQGILLFDGSRTSQLFVNSMSDPSHGPKASCSQHESATAMLAYCRISKEDCLSSRGQEEEWADGQVFLALDGIVDNGPELSLELQKLGCNIRASSPVEVLLAALEQWGLDCLSRITGSFAFAALDLRRHRLILVRDTFGTRPLYYASRNGCELFFASHIGCLMEAACIARRLNRASLYRYLAYNTMDHGAETFFAGIQQVPPGHYMEVFLENPTRAAPVRYRRVVRAQTKLTFEAASERVRELVVRAVASQVGTHNAVGAALSGGFDSCFVVAAFKRAQPRAQLKLYTCVPVLKRGTFSQGEEEWADLAAAGFQSLTGKVRVKADGLPESFAYLVRLQEEPFSSPVVYAQLQVFRAAQEDGIRVMLSGQGGDTLFTASTDQILLAALGQARRGHLVRAAAILQAGSQLPQGSIERLVRTAARVVMPETLRATVRRWRRLARPPWLKEKYFELDDVVMPECSLPMLRFEDRNSMACSILNRMPLLTTALEDFVCSLPLEYLITTNQPMKSIESAALRGMVPDAILARRKRSGFPVPVREWLEELAPWVDRNIAEIESFPFLEPSCVRQIWKSVSSGNESVSQAFLIWRWVFLAGWVRYCNVSLD
jgi:asparagine synthase (glutamine-hydrolysing)